MTINLNIGKRKRIAQQLRLISTIKVSEEFEKTVKG